MQNNTIRAVLFDFGGVITTSPFEAFHHFERQRGLPLGFLQKINRTDPDHNAWARFERGELSAERFDEVFASESRAAGHEVRGLEVVALVYGNIRPRMTRAVERCRDNFVTACLTNNFQHDHSNNVAISTARPREWESVLALFDEVIESSKVGVRKPETAFFELACEKLSIEPREAVFLDDLGRNLKPARAMGMHTIKVVDPDAALAELSTVLGIEL
ncbi:MAG: HAD-IA family hydrolase [Betaproteobacteria bacterium]|nr:MAG: HAD-IA family hydrolase [Betaproteobacteria bacterium]